MFGAHRQLYAQCVKPYANCVRDETFKINEQLVSKGKILEEVSREEFDDLAQSVGLQRHDPKQK